MHFLHKGVNTDSIDSLNQYVTYSPNDIRCAYKSHPVAPLHGKKTAVITIASIFPFSESFLQSSLDAFCKTHKIPTTILEVIPIELNEINIVFCNDLCSLIISYINDSNGTEFNETYFTKEYVVPWIWANMPSNIPMSEQEFSAMITLALMQQYTEALMEILIDIEWSHAMNPYAHMRVVQSSGGMGFDAVKYASDPYHFANNPWGATDIISISWGYNESAVSASEINDLDKTFNNNAICYLAASGDRGTIAYPATSRNVIGVGGTSLYYDPAANTMSQTTWNNVMGSGGCGPSTYIPKPEFQIGVNVLNAYDKRCSPDIAGIADPSTGVNIIFGSSSGNSMYNTRGGTSVACPVNAGMLSNLIQTSFNRGGPTFTTVLNNGDSTLLQKTLYDMYKNGNQRLLPNTNQNTYAHCFYDVTQGTNNGFSALHGFDIPTGMGSPYWDNIIATLFYATAADICFPANTPVLTDQGIVAIQNIEPNKHTLRNKRIVAITHTVSRDDYLVHFSKHSLGHNYPTEDTRMSKHHKVLYAGRMTSAHHFLTGFKKVSKVEYRDELLYNVLLEEHSIMQINNLTCETLHPKSSVAKLHTNDPHSQPNATSSKFNNIFKNADTRLHGNVVTPSVKNVKLINRMK